MVIDYIDLLVLLVGNVRINVFVLFKEDVEWVSEVVFNVGLVFQLIIVEELVICELVFVQFDFILIVVQEVGEEICLNIIKDG